MKFEVIAIPCTYRGRKISKIFEKSSLIEERDGVKLFLYIGGWKFFSIGEKFSYLFLFGEEGEKIKIELVATEDSGKKKVVFLRNLKTGEGEIYILLI